MRKEKPSDALGILLFCTLKRSQAVHIKVLFDIRKQFGSSHVMGTSSEMNKLGNFERRWDRKLNKYVKRKNKHGSA